jgi:hypothetical protein
MNQDSHTPLILARPAADDHPARTHVRYEMSIATQILFPEDTFSPVTCGGKTLDMSARGMKLYFDNFPLHFYIKLLARSRMARIRLEDPFDGTELKITGRIVWIDYHDGPCFMGLCFDEKDGNLAPYLRLIENVRDAAGQAAPPPDGGTDARNGISPTP